MPVLHAKNRFKVAICKVTYLLFHKINMNSWFKWLMTVAVSQATWVRFQQGILLAILHGTKPVTALTRRQWPEISDFVARCTSQRVHCYVRITN